MSIAFIILGAWAFMALLMVSALATAARRPGLHAETSSLDSLSRHGVIQADDRRFEERTGDELRGRGEVKIEGLHGSKSRK